MDKFTLSYRDIRPSEDTFSTDSPQKMWKIQKACHVLVVVCFLLGLFFVGGCSQGKGVEKFKKLPRGTTLIGMNEAEVKKAIGEPDEISKTPEDKILWKYKPSWKLLPSPKDTLYVEFDNGKAYKAFQIK